MKAKNLRPFLFLEITIFEEQNRRKNKWSSDKKRSSVFALRKWCSSKTVFGQSGCPVTSSSLVGWASFFGAVFLLVNENMVPLAGLRTRSIFI